MATYCPAHPSSQDEQPALKRVQAYPYATLVTSLLPGDARLSADWMRSLG